MVPRHIERVSEIEKILSSYNYCLRTKPTLNAEIYVVNTIGELQQILSLAHFIFIGKSLDPNIGGQTPIEAAALGKPIVYGPHMENFRAICRSLEANGGAVRCCDAMAVREQLLYWIENPKSAEMYAKAAQRWICLSRGATKKMIISFQELGIF